MSGTLIIGVISAILGGLIWAVRTGRATERAIASRDQAAAKAQAVIERMDMVEESRKRDNEISGMTDEALDKELASWGR